MRNSQDGFSRSPGFLGLPRTRLGWWSIGLAITFLVLFPLWLFYALYLRRIPRPTFFSDPLHAFLLLSSSKRLATSASRLLIMNTPFSSEVWESGQPTGKWLRAS